MKPKILTKLPGPKAKNLIKIDEEVMSTSYTRVYPLVVKKGKGVWIEDIDGNTFLDFTAGIAVCSTGHCHPKVVEAIKNQVDQLIHMSGTDFYYSPQILLAKKLNSLFDDNIQRRVYFGNSGAEAVESAFKLARYYTKRKLNIAFIGAFHGRTMGALSLTGSKAVQKKYFSPMVPGVIHAPYAYCYRCPYLLTPHTCKGECTSYIEDVLFKTITPPEEVAAIFVEPIQGEGGYIVPPKKFHTSLSEIAKKYNILLVADEVQSGMGRTGKMFAMEHFGVTPDIIALAKGIASGMPLGLSIAKEEIMDWESGSHASTFGGNPISCQAAIATIDLLLDSLVENARVQGKYLKNELKKLQKSHECIGDVRGKGLMLGIELVEDRETKCHAVELRDKIINEAFHKGLLLLGCGKSSIRFSPGLVVSREEINTCLNIFGDIITHLSL